MQPSATAPPRPDLVVDVGWEQWDHHWVVEQSRPAHQRIGIWAGKHEAEGRGIGWLRERGGGVLVVRDYAGQVIDRLVVLPGDLDASDPLSLI